jgi:1,4-alpha-glucan branching enzyme
MVSGVNEQTLKNPSLLESDPWLAPFSGAVEHRIRLTAERQAALTENSSLYEFASAHHYFGLHQLSKRADEQPGSEPSPNTASSAGWVFRERLPNASRVYLIGDFNAWQETYDYRLLSIGNGTWEGIFPENFFTHNQHYKMKVYWREGEHEVSAERIPPHARRVVQDATTKIFSAQVWAPEARYVWKNESFAVPKRAPRIYEAHVGMAQEEPQVGTYSEFMTRILPRIARAGYNTIQLMAIQEHPYYGSFGYQVSNFYAPSSRFGTPEELKALIDAAHSLGIAVIMDLVHSHAVKNELEGLSRIDGTTTLYFHEGGRGEHPAWSTRLFDYAKPETVHFLLSNCRYWIEEFRFDGFRFDGVTSMIYHDHGLGRAFDSYERYFDGNVDLDALVYLTLSNRLIHHMRPDALCVAEEVSGMPGLAATEEVGGMGFDYRLAMGVPDYWIKLIKDRSDEQWDVSDIWWELTNRRGDEQTISYCESHDQALVGDKTIIFRLADKEMYWCMRREDQNLIVERAIALHKMIRLITLATAGHGYLNFMGNEFGHPEWIDFPREGNNWSYHYARRQWSLRDNPDLRFGELSLFDQRMMELAQNHQFLETRAVTKLFEHVADAVLAFERAGILFVFNFHPTNSYADRNVPAPAGRYRVVLSSDSLDVGGYDRIDTSLTYESNGQIRLYLPSRTAVVLSRGE